MALESSPLDNLSPTDATNPLLRQNLLVTPLEQEVLDEYAKLLENMNEVRVIQLYFQILARSSFRSSGTRKNQRLN